MFQPCWLVYILTTCGNCCRYNFALFSQGWILFSFFWCELVIPYIFRCVSEPVVPMKRPRVYCFPQDAQVETNKNQKQTMATIQIGDRIKTLDHLGNPIYSEVIAFLHRQQKTTAEYLSISTSNGRTLRVSSKHLVFRIDNISRKTEAVFASELTVGDLVQTSGTSSESTRVVEITMATHVGVYAPLTRHGTMLVDGVLVSCYAHWDSHTIAHIVMAPLRIWSDVSSLAKSLMTSLGYQGNQVTNNFAGINWYALSLMNIVEKFIPLHWLLCQLDRLKFVVRVSKPR